MKISYDEDGFQGVVSCLSYLAAMSTEDIESDDFECLSRLKYFLVNVSIPI